MRRDIRGAIAASAAVLCLFGFTPASAGQLDVKDAPVLSGPLEETSKRCARRSEVVNGRTVAIARYCLRFYQYSDVTAISDATKRYGILWLQTSFNPIAANWCAKVVNSDIKIPAGTTLREKRPRFTLWPIRSLSQVTTLAIGSDVVSAPATLSQTWIKRPRSTTPKMINDGRTFRLRWEGRAGAKVALVSAAEIQWDVVDGAPDTVELGLTYTYGRDNRC